MNMPNINFTTCGLTNKAIASITTCASNTYEYIGNKLDTAKQEMAPYVSSLIRCAEIAGALCITGVFLQALANLAIQLPVVDTITAVVIATYALRHSEQCAQAVALFAFGSVVIKTLASASLLGMQAFALYFSAIIIANKVAKTDSFIV